VQRVLALRGWPERIADLAVCVRQRRPEPGALRASLDAGDLIRSYAFRGGSYVFGHEVGSVLLAVRTASAAWRDLRWQRQGRFVIDDWEPVRDAIRVALEAGPLTRGEIAAHLERTPGLRHLAAAATGIGSDALYKPLHWWGDICFGPERDGQATFRLLSNDPGWPGLPDVDDAGRQAISWYLGAYGPATIGNLVYWLTDGLSVPRRLVRRWLEDLGDSIAEVTEDGVAAYAVATDLEELAAVAPSDAVRLLPAYDPWVMGPGTDDVRIVAPDRRSVASHGGNLVIRCGTVSGTWRRAADVVTVSWFEEAGPAPLADLATETQRLASAWPCAPKLELEVL
jgi:hypothetical protein